MSSLYQPPTIWPTWREHAHHVFLLRSAWMQAPHDDEAKARFDHAFRAYQTRFVTHDCEGGVCSCTYQSAPAAITSDAADPSTVRFDSGDSTMPTFDHFLRLAGGNHSQASVLELQAARNRQRDVAKPAMRSDANDAAQAMRQRHLLASTANLSATTATVRDEQERAAVVGERIARQTATEVDLRRYRADAQRFDATGTGAATQKCSSCKVELTAADIEDSAEQCMSCRADSAERAAKVRGHRAWQRPLQASKPGFGGGNGGEAA